MGKYMFTKHSFSLIHYQILPLLIWAYTDLLFHHSISWLTVLWIQIYKSLMLLDINPSLWLRILRYVGAFSVTPLIYFNTLCNLALYYVYFPSTWHILKINSYQWPKVQQHFITSHVEKTHSSGAKFQFSQSPCKNHMAIIKSCIGISKTCAITCLIFFFF